MLVPSFTYLLTYLVAYCEVTRSMENIAGRRDIITWLYRAPESNESAVNGLGLVSRESVDRTVEFLQFG